MQNSKEMTYQIIFSTKFLLSFCTSAWVVLSVKQMMVGEMKNCNYANFKCQRKKNWKITFIRWTSSFNGMLTRNAKNFWISVKSSLRICIPTFINCIRIDDGEISNFSVWCCTLAPNRLRPYRKLWFVCHLRSINKQLSQHLDELSIKKNNNPQTWHSIDIMFTIVS